MEFRVVDREQLDLSAWKNLTHNHSFFHTPAWADVCVAGLSGSPRAVFLCGYRNRQLRLGLPGIITRRYRFSSFYSMPNGTYGGICSSGESSPEEVDQFCTALIDYFDREKFSRIMIVDFEDKPGLHSWKGFQREKHFTHIIRPSNTEDYQVPEKRIARHLRSGQRKNDNFFIMDSGRMDDFYSLYLDNEKRHRNPGPLYKHSFFKSLLDILGKSEKLYWTGLADGESLIGSQINFIHSDTLFYWQGIFDYNKRDHKPSYILMHDAIRHGLEMGVRNINLGASPPQAVGLIDYKTRWGGEKIEYGILSYRSKLRKLLGR